MSTPSTRSGSRRAALAAALAAIAFAALYAFTAQRGVSWGDSGLFQNRILAGDLAGNAGIALAHPLYVAIARIFSGLVPAAALPWFLNAFSGMWGALATAGMLACAWRLTRSLGASVLAALSLGCAHMFWWLSAMSEVYTLSVFLLSCEMYCLLSALQDRKPLPMVAALLANGVHFSVHNFALLSLPVHLAAFLWIVRKDGRRAAAFLAPGLAAWIVGALPILVMAVDRHGAAGSLRATILDVLVGRYGAAVAGNMGVPFRVTLFNYAIACMSFMLPCWPLAAWTLARRRGRSAWRWSPETLSVAAILAVHFLFWVRYRVADQATFLLPTLFLSVLLASPLLASVRRPAIWACATIAASVLVPCATVAAMSPFADRLIRRSCPLPFRDDLRYFALPWKHGEDSAARFVAATARELPHDAFIYVDPTVEGPLAAARRLGILPPTISLSSDPPQPIAPSSRWELRPFGAYRASPPEATIEKKGTFHKVNLP